MTNHESIIGQYKEELDKVERCLVKIFDSYSSILPTIGFHIVKSGGKRLRPLFLLLSAELSGAKDDSKYLLASIIEAIHTASLLHDDVIDGAKTRRGMPSANSKWGNQIVILVGDYLYSNALRLAVGLNNQKIMDALSNATTKMTEGEIIQLEKTANPDLTLKEYYKIIEGKTAALISCACRIGAIIGQSDREKEDKLAEFGFKTGMAFQLVDDILDYSAESKDLGKQLGKDLEEGKITLPLINLLNSASTDEKQEVCEIIAQHNKQKGKNKRLKRILDLFSKYDSIGDSLKIASQFVKEAKDALIIFEDSPAKQSLLALSEYSLTRKR
ncbi:MAG: polyprenyl synthetase family protein [Thermodesulfovibrionales bacterium]